MFDDLRCGSIVRPRTIEMRRTWMAGVLNLIALGAPTTSRSRELLSSSSSASRGELLPLDEEHRAVGGTAKAPGGSRRGSGAPRRPAPRGSARQSPGGNAAGRARRGRRRRASTTSASSGMAVVGGARRARPRRGAEARADERGGEPGASASDSSASRGSPRAIVPSHGRCTARYFLPRRSRHAAACGGAGVDIGSSSRRAVQRRRGRSARRSRPRAAGYECSRGRVAARGECRARGRVWSTASATARTVIVRFVACQPWEGILRSGRR